MQVDIKETKGGVRENRHSMKTKHSPTFCRIHILPPEPSWKLPEHFLDAPGPQSFFIHISPLPTLLGTIFHIHVLCEKKGRRGTTLLFIAFLALVIFSCLSSFHIDFNIPKRCTPCPSNCQSQWPYQIPPQKHRPGHERPKKRQSRMPRSMFSLL